MDGGGGGSGAQTIHLSVGNLGQVVGGDGEGAVVVDNVPRGALTSTHTVDCSRRYHSGGGR